MPMGMLGKWEKKTTRRNGVIIHRIGFLGRTVPDQVHVYKGDVGFTISTGNYRSEPVMESHIPKGYWDVVQADIMKWKTHRTVKRIKIKVKKPYGIPHTKAYKTRGEAVKRRAVREAIEWAADQL